MLPVRKAKRDIADVPTIWFFWGPYRLHIIYILSYQPNPTKSDLTTSNPTQSKATQQNPIKSDRIQSNLNPTQGNKGRPNKTPIRTPTQNRTETTSPTRHQLTRNPTESISNNGRALFFVSFFLFVRSSPPLYMAPSGLASFTTLRLVKARTMAMASLYMKWCFGK